VLLLLSSWRIGSFRFHLVKMLKREAFGGEALFTGALFGGEAGRQLPKLRGGVCYAKERYRNNWCISDRVAVRYGRLKMPT
jgi:hypothetical protein